MTSRSVSACALVVTLFSIVGVACADGAVEGPDRNLKSAGMLSESRLPYGIFGDSPAPTGALPRDKALEQGWYKRAPKGEKAPTAGDRASLLSTISSRCSDRSARRARCRCASLRS